MSTTTRWGLSSRKPLDIALAAGFLATLVALLAHAWIYRFLTDDAYISFRYARNFAHGDGLVFNPGFERVEGYTNFLWVMMLAACNVAGVLPETAAPILSGAATVALWGVVVWFVLRSQPREERGFLVLVPTILLAATRTFAVWSSGGLETRLFELLVVSGALRLLVEDEKIEAGEPAVRSLAALLFALASLTRPDGLLIATCVGVALGAWRWKRLPQRLGWLARSLGVFVGLVGAHLLFRRAYYGEWVPNTYYAKVGGSSWWASGLEYLAAFALEYAVYLWIPLLIAAVAYHRRRGTLVTPIVFAAVVVPHVVYVASIGGDHFEYRPLDVYLPLLFILVFFGAVHLARGPWAKRWVGLNLAFVVVGIVELPYRSHVQFLKVYAPGFPGIDLGKHVEADRFLAPERSPIYRLPGLRALAAAHRRLVVQSTTRFVAIRQEEHALFLGTAIAEARDLRRLIDSGVIPKDTHIAVDCVGAIPYYTGLRVLDRLGLTDARVAHGPFVREMMAHGKQASPEYAKEIGVDLWAENPVHLLWRRDDPRFVRRLFASYPRKEERFFADVGNGQFLLAWFPQGPERARSRFPTLNFESTHDKAAIERVADAVREARDR